MKFKSFFPQSVKNIYHLFQAVSANFVNGFPGRSDIIKIIGVTGTNGKTTTVQMITRILEESGAKVAMASTINFKLGKKEWVNATKFTTLSAFQIQKFIRRAVEENCGYLVLETSSHSLDQHRVWGIRYDMAVITNVTREHLDYHKTMEKYRKAKMKIFENVRVVAVNLDMENPGDFLNCGARKKFGYTVSGGKKHSGADTEIVEARDLELGISYSKYRAEGLDFELKIPGRFNVENSLAALCAAKAYGVDLKVAKRALEKISGIPGRMEDVPNSKGIDIIIDYALTPDSLEKFYSLLSKNKKEGARIRAVFGSCGDRDRGKRPIMGEIVDKYADYIIITNEDPYSEDPRKIMDEVASGVKSKKEGENFFKILDRREAIRKALQSARSGDILAVTGKGAEETMMIGDKMIPWNDKKVILEELERME